MAVGAIEPQFYDLLLRGLQIDPATVPPQMDRAAWPSMKRRLAAIFSSRTREEWTRIFADSDACVTPVLSPEEAASHPHAQARGAFRNGYGAVHPAPVPRFSRSEPVTPAPPPAPGEHSEAVLCGFGFTTREVEELRSCGALA